ncbi:MAG: alanyl-tRNA editing protein, partial [Gammaproteobacteria bacterium]
MTEELFREDGYLKSCEARVTAVTDNGFAVDRTVFYPMGGGQPGDTGYFEVANNSHQVEIIDTYKDRESGLHLHVVADGAELPSIGDKVVLKLDWERRHRLMRMHSCMHMLCAAVPEP